MRRCPCSKPRSGKELLKEDQVASEDQELAAAQALQSCEDHVKVRQEVQRCRESLLPQDAGAEAAVAPADAPTEMVTGSGGQIAALPAAGTLNALGLMARVRGLPALQAVPSEESALACLVQRMAAIREPLKEFCGLSPAMILSGCTSKESTWNCIQHDLALARQASALQGGQRQSRAAQWTSLQQRVHSQLSTSDSADGPLQAITHFGSHSQPQVLLYLLDDGTVAEGLVMCVYRAAVLDASGTRRLKVARPSASPLPVAMCKTARVCCSWCSPTSTTGWRAP